MAPGKLYFWIHCIVLWNVLEIIADQCQDQLGMEQNLISDDAITASSTFADSVAPQNARIRQEVKGGAWCPKQLVDKDAYEYLQIDLGKIMVITKVEVQGRFGNGQGREYAEIFLLDYQRQDGGKWIRFKNKFGREKFKGNTNTYSAAVRDVSPQIIGKRIRFVPFSHHLRLVCMRVEMYGCEWTGQCQVPVIKNATMVGLQELVYVNHNTEIQFQCNNGLVPRDSPNMKCDNGTWSDYVECVPDLPSQPVITGYQTGQVLRENDTVQLMCTSEGGNPLAQIAWFRNNALVDVSYSHTGNRAENELIITAQRSDNDAEYRCEAWNKFNADNPLVVTRTLLVFFAPKTATITGTRAAKAGETLTLTCTTSNSNPAAVVEWISQGSSRTDFRSRIEHSPNGGFITISEIDITLTHNQTSAIYTCSATNHQFGITVADAATVSVLYPSGAPVITGYTEGKPIQAGGLVKLTCSSLGGNPPATLKWFRGDQELTAVNDVSARKNTSIEIVIVSRADDNDATYKCEASNKATDSPLVALRKLTVHYPPSQPEVTGYQTGQVIRVNDTVQLMCISEGGNPLAQIAWFRNNVGVDFSYSQRGNRAENELTITAQRSDNDAEYKCEAWNMVNADHPLVVSRKLLVFFAPKTATITGTLEAKAGETLTLTCTTSNSNPAAVVRWISHGSNRTDIRSRIEHSPNGGFITISEIEITLTYTQTNAIYTCSATNPQFGITVAGTAIVSVLYPPGAPQITGYTEGKPIRAGDLVKLRCSALGGNPLATLKWFRGDQELTEVNDLSARNISSIEITIVARADDNGVIYKCEASNKATDSPLVALRKLTVYCQCQVPLITNATVVGLPELVYVNHNTEVKYQCYSGYVPRDSSTMKCDNGTWSGSVECVQETDCGWPGPLYNGYVIGYRTTVGSAIFFSCNTHTTFVGDSIQSQCLDTGEWSNKPPTCWGQCQVPVIPSATVDGLQELVYVNHDTEVQYQCNSGLVPRDSSNMKCYNGTWSSSVECVPDQCHHPLGMENNLISDDAITASSTYDHSVGPQNARIRQEINGGAWCPSQLVDKDSYAYLQIDLGKLMVITQVEVQGRFGNGQGQEWAETFLLEYQRQDGGKWIRFKNKLGQEKFEGNENTYVAAMRDVSPPIIGKRIRFVPFSHHPRLVCMRVEMYGCECTAVASKEVSELEDSSQKHVEHDVRLPSDNATNESNRKIDGSSSTHSTVSVPQGKTPDSSEGDGSEAVSDKEICSSQKIQLEFNQEIEVGLKMLAKVGGNRVQELVNILIRKIHHRNKLLRTEDSSQSV